MSLATLDPFSPEAEDYGFSDRVPPQDVAAEAAVLGAMMVSKDAIGEVVEIVSGSD
ncbi:MAG: hypothetical protein LBR32_09745, partial [Propionibacteriaceae bacterium]|nr:hypothetical protein [Propionibacteriaceae bacterium]